MLNFYEGVRADPSYNKFEIGDPRLMKRAVYLIFFRGVDGRKIIFV